MLLHVRLGCITPKSRQSASSPTFKSLNAAERSTGRERVGQAGRTCRAGSDRRGERGQYKVWKAHAISLEIPVIENVTLRGGRPVAAAQATTCV